MIPAMRMEFTPPKTEGEYQVPIRYGSYEGEARYSLLHWAGAGNPSLIYHHGSGETKYTARIQRILPKSVISGINLVAISIPWNRSMKEYLYGIGSLERFCMLMASSVRLFESTSNWLCTQGSGKIVASGISLGGWITNLHSSIYASMDEYRPIFAGAALDHLFTDTIYRNMTSVEARENANVLKDVLNFEPAFETGNPSTVFPLLARYDQYIHYGRQKGIYHENQVSTLDKGHITGTMDMRALRKHLINGLGIGDG